jgi:bacterial/archaeal transporter family-2 protein
MMLIARIPWPSLPSIAGTPWWGWLGGALSAIYAVTMVLLARELGAATLTALAVTGQLVCSVMLDHFGWVGFHEHAAGLGRIVGCLLMVAGVLLDCPRPLPLHPRPALAQRPPSALIS